jgi:hypothetical protein
MTDTDTDSDYDYDSDRSDKLRNTWIQAAIDDAPLEKQIAAGLAGLDDDDTVYLVYLLVTDVADILEALSLRHWPLDSDIDLAPLAAAARRAGMDPRADGFALGTVLHAAFLAAQADHDHPDWWPAWLDAREVLDVPAAEQLLADWVTDRIRRAGMAPEGIRRVTLSDGRTVAVDADDPNPDEAIRQAYEEGGR